MSLLDPHTVARAILANAQKHFVYGNGLMNVFIFDKLCKGSVRPVRGYLNVKTPADHCVSVRHFYVQIADGEEMIDPTFFTQQMIENELSNTSEALYENTQEEEARDMYFDQIVSGYSDGYWLLTHKKCVDVYKGVLKDLGLRLEDYPIPTRKVSVNEECPCRSLLKYKRCHAKLGPIV